MIFGQRQLCNDEEWAIRLREKSTKANSESSVFVPLFIDLIG
jgi:hypothetical protein